MIKKMYDLFVRQEKELILDIWHAMPKARARLQGRDIRYIYLGKKEWKDKELPKVPKGIEVRLDMMIPEGHFGLG